MANYGAKESPSLRAQEAQEAHEADAIAKALAEDERLDAYRRTKLAKWFVLFLLIGASCVAALVGAVLFVAWAWHLVSPSDYEWMSSDKLTNLERFVWYVVATVAGGLLVKFWKKHSD